MPLTGSLGFPMHIAQDLEAIILHFQQFHKTFLNNFIHIKEV